MSQQDKVRCHVIIKKEKFNNTPRKEQKDRQKRKMQLKFTLSEMFQTTDKHNPSGSHMQSLT